MKKWSKHLKSKSKVEPSVQQNFYFALNMGTFFFKVRNDTKFQVKQLNCNWIKIPIQKNLIWFPLREFAVKSSIWIYPFSIKQSDKVVFIGILLWAPLPDQRTKSRPSVQCKWLKRQVVSIRPGILLLASHLPKFGEGGEKSSSNYFLKKRVAILRS